MSTWDVIILSLIQGLSEFLPISSSAHLILLPKLLGHADQGLAFDIAVHFGTLIAVLLYFKKELQELLLSCWRLLQGKAADANSHLALLIVIGTVPVGLIGLLSKDWVALYMRSTEVIAYATIGFALLLAYADKYACQRRCLAELNWRDAVYIGFAQALALIPGTSRSGVTLTCGLLRHLDKSAAAKYSFLLSIPVIMLASLLSIKDFTVGESLASSNQLLLALLLSATSAYCCIHIFLRMIVAVGLMPFVYYRLLLGVALLWFG